MVNERNNIMRVAISFCMIFLTIMPTQVIGQAVKHYNVSNKKSPQKTTINPAKVIDTVDDICFPLAEDHVYNLYGYIIDLQDPFVVKKYSALFKKYDYVFSGYVWEGILKEMINSSEDKDLTENVFIKSQKDMVGFTFTKPDVSKRLPTVLCPIFNNPKTFEHFIKNADRKRIKNY